MYKMHERSAYARSWGPPPRNTANTGTRTYFCPGSNRGTAPEPGTVCVAQVERFRVGFADDPALAGVSSPPVRTCMASVAAARSSAVARVISSVIWRRSTRLGTDASTHFGLSDRVVTEIEDGRARQRRAVPPPPRRCCAPVSTYWNNPDNCARFSTNRAGNRRLVRRHTTVITHSWCLTGHYRSQGVGRVVVDARVGRRCGLRVVIAGHHGLVDGDRGRWVQWSRRSLDDLNGIPA